MTVRTMNPPITLPETTTRRGVTIREAVEGDNEGLLALTRMTPMAGRIALRIDREPDFFALIRARGEAIVYVAEYQNRVVGCMSAAVHVAYVSGVLEKVAHVGDLKVHPQFSGTRVAMRLIAAIGARLRAERVDMCLSVIAGGNERAMRLTEGKHGTPAAEPQGFFVIDQLIPLPFSITGNQDYEARQSDVPEIAEMLRLLREQRNFATPVEMAELEQRLKPGRPTFSKVLVLRDGGRVVAALTVEDTQSLRHNVVLRLPIMLGVAFGVFRVSSRLICKIKVPQVGQPLAIVYIRFMACVQGQESALRKLIAQARVEAFRGGFAFLSVGLHERDPMRNLLTGIPRFSFRSYAMISSLITPGRARSLAAQVPFEDFALV